MSQNLLKRIITSIILLSYYFLILVINIFLFYQFYLGIYLFEANNFFQN